MNNTPSSNVLEIQAITRRFGGLVAVNQVSFTVTEKEIFGLIGPNGAGKTTLFNLITGLIPVTHGKFIYQGKNITKLPTYQIAKQGIARTFQNLRLFGNLSVFENVAIARHIHCQTNIISGIINLPNVQKEEKQTLDKVQQLLELVGLKEERKQIAKTLAYGDQRRLEIARALALEPKILLLDEPAAGMNPNEKGTLSELILQIRSLFNLTIILIEHNVPLVMGLCDRIAVLDFGQLIALGNPETVKNDQAVIEAYLGNN